MFHRLEVVNTTAREDARIARKRAVNGAENLARDLSSLFHKNN